MNQIASAFGKYVARRWPAQAALRLERQSEVAAVKAFLRAARRVPAYAKLLATKGVAAGQVQDIASFFALVPLTDKKMLFGGHALHDLCVDGRLADAAAFYTSSGYSGEFSFGVETRGDETRIRRQIDASLQFHIQADRRSTLVINALPMGVRVPVSIAACIDTSTRSDAVLAAVERIGPSFDQILLIGEHPFLKKVLEEGVEKGVDWKRRRVSLTTGAEVMPENFRGYAGGILGHDPDKPEQGLVIISLGISEVGLSMGQETPDARRIRRAAHQDAALRNKLFGDRPFVPTLAQYFPDVNFLETVAGTDGIERLVVTTAERGRRMPLIRYATGDAAQVFSYGKIAQLVTDAGRSDLVPELPLPFVAVWGRGRGVVIGSKTVYPEQIKEAIYQKHRDTPEITAYFQLQAQGDALGVRLQLRPGRVGTAALRTSLEATIKLWTQVPAVVSLVSYAEFGAGMELSYQRKFQYM